MKNSKIAAIGDIHIKKDTIFIFPKFLSWTFAIPHETAASNIIIIDSNLKSPSLKTNKSKTPKAPTINPIISFIFMLSFINNEEIITEKKD